MKRIGPGPAKYLLPSTIGYDKHDSTKLRLPMYSMGIRPIIEPKTQGPGAGKYHLENKSRYGEKSYQTYIGKRLIDTKQASTPGPAKYKLPDLIGAKRTKQYKDTAPDYSMAARLNLKNPSITPGPKYLLPELMGAQAKNIYANKPPVYTMRPNTVTKFLNVGPGPAKYDPRREEQGALYITIKHRHGGKVGSIGPGANRYNLSEYKPGTRRPLYSMGMALSGVAQPMIVPGDNCC